MEEGRFFYVKNVKCAGCGARRTYTGKGLRMKYNSKANWKLLLACSSPCAEKFVKRKPDHSKKENATATSSEPETLLTRYGSIPYRNAQEGKI